MLYALAMKLHLLLSFMPHEMSYDPAVLKDRAEFLRKQLDLASPMPLLCKDLGLTATCGNK